MDYLDILEIDGEGNFIIIDEVDYNNNKYLYLMNMNDTTDFFIRKQKDNDTIVGLDKDEEFANVMRLFTEKNMKGTNA